MIKHWRKIVWAVLAGVAAFGYATGHSWGIGLGITATVILLGWLWLKYGAKFQGYRTEAMAWTVGASASVLEILHQLALIDWQQFLKPEYLIYVLIGKAVLTWLYRKYTTTPPGMADEFDRS